MGWRVARVCVFRKGRLSPAEIFVLLAALLTMFCQTLGGPMKDSCLPMGPIDLLQSLLAKMDPAGKGGVAPEKLLTPLARLLYSIGSQQENYLHLFFIHIQTIKILFRSLTISVPSAEAIFALYMSVCV